MPPARGNDRTVLAALVLTFLAMLASGACAQLIRGSHDRIGDDDSFVHSSIANDNIVRAIADHLTLGWSDALDNVVDAEPNCPAFKRRGCRFHRKCHWVNNACIAKNPTPTPPTPTPPTPPTPPPEPTSFCTRFQRKGCRFHKKCHWVNNACAPKRPLPGPTPPSPGPHPVPAPTSFCTKFQRKGCRFHKKCHWLQLRKQLRIQLQDQLPAASSPQACHRIARCSTIHNAATTSGVIG